MEVNPDEKPIETAFTGQSNPLDEVSDILVAATFDQKLGSEDKAKYLERLSARKEDIKAAFDQPFKEHRAFSFIRRLQNTLNFGSDKPRDNDFVRLGLSLFEEIIPKAEDALKVERVELEDVLDAYSNLVNYGNPKQSKTGIDGLASHLEEIEQGLMDDKAYLRHAAYLEPMLRLGNDHQRTKALFCLLAVAYAKIDGQQFSCLISKLYTIFSYEQEAEKAVQTFLERHRLPYGEIYSAWMQSANYNYRQPSKEKSNQMLFREVICKNLGVIQEVDAEVSGTCKFLYEEFNIADFGRYPAKLLLKQREEFESRQNPYGAIVYPRDDWNGAFYQDWHALDMLFEKTEGFSLRVFECKGKVDVVRALRKCDELYNPPDGSGHKISLLIIGGHGSENSIRFGKEDKRHVLYTEDLSRKVAGKSGEYLDENPTIILASCSTGADKGIGRELSKKFGAKVVAPKKPTSLSELYGSKDRSGRFRFNAKFSDKEAGIVFKEGMPVEK